MSHISSGVVTTSTALTALLTQINVTAAQLKAYGGPTDLYQSTMSADHLAQTLEALAAYVKSGGWRTA